MSEKDFELLLDDLKDLADGLESVAVKLARAIQKLQGLEPQRKGSPELPFHADRIAWKDATGEKGPYGRAEDYENPDHKALVQFLNDHIPSKCVTSQGFFYWLFSDGRTVGRRPKNRKQT
jgi:hypothetical protein